MIFTVLSEAFLMKKSRSEPEGVENYVGWEQTTFRREISHIILSEEILMDKGRLRPDGVENYVEWEQTTFRRKISRLNVYTEELLCNNSHDEGNYRNRYTDSCHLEESGGELQVLRDGGIVGEAGYYEYDYYEH